TASTRRSASARAPRRSKPWRRASVARLATPSRRGWKPGVSISPPIRARASRGKSAASKPSTSTRPAAARPRPSATRADAGRPRPRAAAVEALETRQRREVGDAVETRMEARGLDQSAHPRARLAREVRRVEALDEHAPRVRALQAQRDAHRRRLPRAVVAEEAV